jgi:TonB-dependent starch-binding outer membrane protein SusC
MKSLTTQLFEQTRKWLLVLPLVLFGLVAFAQNARITGKVTDDTNEGLPGVSVQVKGTATGTVTDIDGNFSISAPREGTLVFSYTGYGTQEVYVGNQNNVSVTLAPSDNVLSDVVVVGYSSQSRRDITGSVAVVDMKDANKVVASNFVDQLQGKVAGVQMSTSGDPGSAAFVRIRGIGSFNNNEPLYVIDGVPVSNETNLNFLNPNDIESMQVLKDGASASIYGARAANGVIVITTKKGRVGKSKITFDYTYGNQNATKRPDLCSPEELLQLTIGQAEGAGQPVTNPMYVRNADGSLSLPDYIARGPGGVIGGFPAGHPSVDPDKYFLTSDPLAGADNNYLIQKANQSGTQWFDEVFNSAPMNNYQVAAQGGSDAGSYYLAANYLDYDGILYKNGYKRYQTRMNSTFRVKDHIRVGENLNIAYQTTQAGVGNPGEGSAIMNAYRMPGLIPVRDIEGYYGGGYGSGSNAGNPVAQQERAAANFGHNVRIFGSMFAEADFLKYFTFKTLFGGDYGTGRNKSYNPRNFEATEVNSANSLNESQFTNTNWVFTNTLKFGMEVTSGVRLDVIGGFESRRNDYVGFNAGGSRLDFDDPNFHILNNVFPASRGVGGYKGANSKVSQFGNLTANLYDKYLISATVRRDGSSRFAKRANRYGVFPGVSVGWRMSEEGFLKGNKAITNLKLRAGYGVTGNDEATGDFPGFTNFSSSIGTASYDINGTGNSVVVGYEQSSTGNPELKWETTTMLDLGFDLTLFNKLDIVAEWYNRQTNDIITRTQLPFTGPSGGDPVINIGDMSNKGIDLQVNYRGKVSKDFSYNLGVTFSHYKNEVLRIDANDNTFFRSGGSRIGDISYTTSGAPMAQFFGYQTDGLWQNWDQINAVIDTSNKVNSEIRPGRFKFVDQNNDRIIDDKDEVIIGSPIPDFFYGLNLSFNYKAFDFTAYFQGVQGVEIFNYVKYFSHTPAFQANYSRDMLYEAGKSLPVLDATDVYSNKRSDFYVEDGSYFRARNIQLGYTLPSSALSRIGVDKLRVFVQAQNAFTITKYSGLDPDVTIDNIQEGYVSQRDLALGIDRGRYPMARQFIFGINVEF